MMLTKYRRDLHQIPEIAHLEFKTHSYILSELRNYDCVIHELKPTGIVAYFDFKRENTIAFRTDMDGLLIREENKVGYKSNHEGKMHACGHDGHMATLLQMARELNEKKGKNNVVLIFQPAEETITGADQIIDSHLLEKYQVSSIYGFHLWPKLPKGRIYSRKGPLMAMASEVDIFVKGESVHVANFERGKDALFIGTRLLQDIYDYELKELQEVRHLLKFGRMESGTVRNIISDSTLIQGTVRCYNQKVFEGMKNKLISLCDRYGSKYHTSIEIAFSKASSPVINEGALLEELDSDIFYLEEPVLQGEDFGNYREKCPSVFYFLGCGDVSSLHTNTFDFEEKILEKMVKHFMEIANHEFKETHSRK